jgi:hypothetical protein
MTFERHDDFGHLRTLSMRIFLEPLIEELKDYSKI